MDFTKALTYPFDDPDWVSKLGIAVGITLLFFIPVIGTIPALLLFAGWSYETAKNVRNGVPNPLASWSDFGGLLGRGLQLAIPYIVYQLPSLVIACLMGAVWVLPAMGGENEDAVAGLLGAASLIQFCCICIIILYALAAAVVYSGGYIRYMDNEQLGTFFQFGDNFALVQNNIGDFGMALIFMIIGGFIGGLLSGTGIGFLVAMAFQNYFNAHIIGQLATKLRGGTMMPQV